MHAPGREVLPLVVSVVFVVVVDGPSPFVYYFSAWLVARQGSDEARALPTLMLLVVLALLPSRT